MKIKKISGRNVKVPAIDIEITSPVTVITGNNCVGKTAVTDTLRLALLGYLPELGTRPSASQAINCKPSKSMVAAVEFDNGQRQERAFTGSKVVERIDENIKFEPIAFSADEYLGATGKARVAWLFKAVSGGQAFDHREITAKLKSIRVENHTAEAERVIDEINDDICTLARDREETDTSLADFMTGVIDRVAENGREAGATVKRMAATLQAQAHIEANEGLAFSPNVSGVLDGLRKRKNELMEQSGRRQSLIARLNTLKVKLDNLKTWTSKNAPTETLESLKASAEELAKKYSGKNSGAERIRNSINAKRRELDTVVAQISRAKCAVVQAKGLIERYGMDISRLQSELDAATSGECCPECGSKNKVWKEKRAAKYTPRLTEAQKNCQDETIRVNVLTSGMEGLVANMDTIQYDIEKLTKDLAAEIEVDKVLDVRRAEHMHVLTKIQTLGDYEHRLTEMQTVAREAEALENEIAAIPSPAAEIDVLDPQIKDLEVQQRREIARRADLQRIQAAKDELAKYETEVAVYREAGKTLLVIQEDLVGRYVGGFMAKAGRIMSRVLGKNLVLVDGDLGVMVNGVFVSHKVFSGTEKLLAYAGLCMALASQSPVKIAILDELGRLSFDNKKTLINMAIDMTNAGELDNFIGIDANETDWLAKKGLQVVNLAA